MRELGFAKIANWRATIILLIWVSLLLAGSVGYRLYQGRLAFPLSSAPYFVVTILGEELIFRGFIQTRMELLQGVQRGWITGSFWFASIHFWNYWWTFSIRGNYSVFSPLLLLLVIGMLWGVAFAKARSLLTTWPVHVIYDIFAVLTS